MGINAKPITIASGSSANIPAGFFTASIVPAPGATYTITNGSGQVSGAITIPYTFPAGLSPDGYNQHTITASGGSVYVIYINGN